MKPGDLVRVRPEWDHERWVEDPGEEITDPTGEELGAGLVVEERLGMLDVWWIGVGRKVLFNQKFLEPIDD